MKTDRPDDEDLGMYDRKTLVAMGVTVVVLSFLFLCMFMWLTSGI